MAMYKQRWHHFIKNSYTILNAINQNTKTCVISLFKVENFIFAFFANWLKITRQEYFLTHVRQCMRTAFQYFVCLILHERNSVVWVVVIRNWYTTSTLVHEQWNKDGPFIFLFLLYVRGNTHWPELHLTNSLKKKTVIYWYRELSKISYVYMNMSVYTYASHQKTLQLNFCPQSGYRVS